MNEEQGVSKKTLLTLVGIVVFLIIIVGYPWWSQFIQKGFKSEVTHNIELGSFDKDKIEQFGIKNGETQMSFKKENDVWKVNEKDVSQDAIDAFFTSLEEIKILELASKNPDNHQNLGLHEEDASLLTIPYKGKIYEYLIGKPGLQMQTFYIKEKGNDNAYLAKGNLYSNVTQTEESWQNIQEEQTT